MTSAEILRINLLSPIALAFALGVFAKVIRSELSLPKDLYASLSIYLLLAIGLKGGVELSEAHLRAIALPAVMTLFLGVLTPVTSYVVLRRLGKFSTSDSAGIAAHYGSVSAVSFIAAQQFTVAVGAAPEGYMPTLLTLLESPGIHIALGIGAVQIARRAALVAPVAIAGGGAVSVLGGPTSELAPAAADGHGVATLREVLTSRTMMLLVGGLVVGGIIGTRGYAPIRPFFDGGFKGALTLFLLEMGLMAGARLSDLKKVGIFLVAFGVVMPVVHGAVAVLLGRLAGLSVGGCTVLATMAASASYIAAPPAVKMNLPEANPTYSLTAALVITFPFNLLVGIPLFYEMAKRIA